jgi:hypothetical protein
MQLHEARRYRTAPTTSPDVLAGADLLATAAAVEERLTALVAKAVGRWKTEGLPARNEQGGLP